MGLKWWKYGAPMLIYFGALHAFLSSGWTVYLPLMYTWVLVPGLELLLPADHRNLTEAEEDLAKKSRAYDIFLYLVLPLQYIALGLFLYTIAFREQGWPDTVGKTAVMGLLCGTFGINVGHELGHRKHPGEQAVAKMLLLTSLYMHFYIEHNKGHHKKVATPEDPSSARLGETVYAFWVRSISKSFLSAWKLAKGEARKKGKEGYQNEMLLFLVIQLIFLCLVFVLFGTNALLLFCAAACMGILLLETVNYIEHYGLQRKANMDGKYERAMPHHSWNSSHVIGRVMLFELSRHSDHHYLASRPYQLLRHHAGAPQMPTGYPGMMLLSLLPTAWFHVMDRRVAQAMRAQTAKEGIIA